MDIRIQKYISTHISSLVTMVQALRTLDAREMCEMCIQIKFKINLWLNIYQMLPVKCNISKIIMNELAE